MTLSDPTRVSISSLSLLRFIEPLWLSDENILLGAHLSIPMPRRDVLFDPVVLLLFLDRIDDDAHFQSQISHWKKSLSSETRQLFLPLNEQLCGRDVEGSVERMNHWTLWVITLDHRYNQVFAYKVCRNPPLHQCTSCWTDSNLFSMTRSRNLKTFERPRIGPR